MEDQLNYEQILKLIAEQDAEYQAKSDELDAVSEQMKAVQRQLQELTSKRNKLSSQRMESLNAKRELEFKKSKAQRKAELEAEQDRLRKLYAEKSAELDKLTANATWRGLAKDKQIEGGKLLAIAKRGILGDKRGLGKTLTSLIWADMVQAKKILVLAINDVVPQYEEEIHTWAKQRQIMPFAGLPPGQRKLVYPMLKNLDSFIITLNYEAWRRDKTVIDSLVDIGIDTVIIDEAHKMKSAEKQTAKGIFQIVFAPNFCPNHGVSMAYYGPWFKEGKANTADPNRVYRCQMCNEQLKPTVENVLSVTGTPILNKPQELYPLVHMISPVAFPTEKSFLEDYCQQYATNRWGFKPGGLDRLRKKIGQSFIQRDRDEFGIEVPPPARKLYELELNASAHPEQHKAYRDLNDAAVLVLEGGEGEAFDQFSILEIINRSRQVMSWPAGINFREPGSGKILCQFDVEESVKVDAVIDLCNDLIEENERFIVFSQFKAGLYAIQKQLGDKVVMATGDDSKPHRDAVRNDFDLKTAHPTEYKWTGALCTYKAFGVGINLNAARHVIILDHEWNPGMEDQAIGRIDRLNSTDQATVHEFYVKDTIDTFMRDLIEEKRKLTTDFEGGVRISAGDLLKGFKEGKL